MFLVETWYLWEETAVPGGKWHISGRKLVFLVENADFVVRELVFLFQNVIFHGEICYFWKKT